MIKRVSLTFIIGILIIAGCEPTASEIWKMNAKAIFLDQRVLELVLAAESGNTKKIEQLAKDGVNVNAKGRYDVTPLLRSIQAKNKDGYLTLLKEGADPNMLDQNGFSPLHLAAEEKDPIWLREALAHGGKPNLENTGNRYYPGQTPLFSALWEGRSENVRLLIVAGADVNHRSKKSGLPLDVAVGHGFENVLLLLEAGAKYRFGNYDLVDSMNSRLRNGMVGMEEENKVWFYKTMEWLEKKGARFDRPKQ